MTNGFAEKWRGLKVVLAHDWLLNMRGGERVLERLCEAFPQAPILTLFHRRGAVSPAIERHKILVSPLQSLPGALKYYRMLLPLFPWAVKRLRPPPADLVISTSHCAAKAVMAPPAAKHLCYCFTPMRYIWLFRSEYFGACSLKRMLLNPVLDMLCRWDRVSCDRVDMFVALSENVKNRIRLFYGRDARVVYPPVDTEYWTPKPTTAPPSQQPAYDLVVSALVPYKRIDLAIAAYNRMDAKLVIVGDGKELTRLRAMAGPNIEFKGRLPDEQIRELYRNARFVIFPGEEDFGLVPVEAQACGTPVIALGRGGTLETVETGVSGVFFDEQTPDALIQAVRRAESMQWDSSAIRKNTEKFSVPAFFAGLSECIEECLSLPPRRHPKQSQNEQNF